MKNCLLLLLSLLVYSVSFAEDQTVQSLVQTERDFAATSVKFGVREAFLSYLSDDSILFRPDAVKGKEWVESHPPRSGILSWEPTQAEASLDLGYTTGPWEFREKNLQDKPVAYGYFVTLWKKQPDGKWKVVLDTGTTNPPPAGAASLFLPPAGATSNKKTDMETAKKNLLKTDQDFCSAFSSKSGAAFESFAADSIRLYRDNIQPVNGKQFAITAISGAASCTPANVGVSSDAALGYTYGSYTLNQEKGNYVRVWKRQDGQWKILIDTSTPD